MICYCPHCANTLPKKLVDGVSFCSNCERVIVSTKENELISAYRVLKNRVYTNYNQLKSDLKLANEAFDLICYCFEEGYSVEEFEKELKNKQLKLLEKF